MGALASDAAARQDVAHRSLTGAIGSLLAQSELLAVELASQEAEHAELRRAATSEHDDALERVIEATEDGSMLHGEVLARWQEFVGTGDLFRSLEVQVGRVRDRVTSLLRGRPAPAKRVEQAIGSSLVELLVAESQRACLATERSWRRAGTSQQALNRALAEVPSQTGLEVVAAALVLACSGLAIGALTGLVSAAPATAVAQVSADTTTTVVRPGQSLWDIAEASGTADVPGMVARIAELNDLKGTTIRAGQTLEIPTA